MLQLSFHEGKGFCSFSQPRHFKGDCINFWASDELSSKCLYTARKTCYSNLLNSLKYVDKLDTYLYSSHTLWRNVDQWLISDSTSKFWIMDKTIVLSIMSTAENYSSHVLKIRGACCLIFLKKIWIDPDCLVSRSIF